MDNYCIDDSDERDPFVQLTEFLSEYVTKVPTAAARTLYSARLCCSGPMVQDLSRLKYHAAMGNSHD